MTSPARKLALPVISIERADLAASIFAVTGADSVAIKAGTVITIDGAVHAFEQDAAIEIISLVTGQDYGVRIGPDGKPAALPIGPAQIAAGDVIGGFHYAPSGNAIVRDGGDGQPAINPLSCWDSGFRPACADPRGMTLVTMPGGARFWADIYLLGVNHLDNGTSHCGAVIADGRDLPQKVDGKGKVRKLDYETAKAIYAHHGKQLLGAEEFFTAAHGVTERPSRDAEPVKTGEMADDGRKFVSRFGLTDATGTMWQWGTDGDPDNPRASLFGGSWIRGVAGSRCAYLDYWPGGSDGGIGARGRSDHLMPA